MQDKALERKQKADLRQLVSRLVQESEPKAIQGRKAKSERARARASSSPNLPTSTYASARSLQDIFQAALEGRLAIAEGAGAGLVPLLCQLPGPSENAATKGAPRKANRLSQLTGELNLTVSKADLAEMAPRALAGLPRTESGRTFRRRLLLHLRAPPAVLLTIGRTCHAASSARIWRPLQYWLAMARQAGSTFDERTGSYRR